MRGVPLWIGYSKARDVVVLGTKKPSKTKRATEIVEVSGEFGASRRVGPRDMFES